MSHRIVQEFSDAANHPPVPLSLFLAPPLDRAPGQINLGQADALRLYLKDNPGDVGKVGAFLNKIDAFVRGGILSEEEAALLRDLGNMLLVSLTTG